MTQIDRTPITMDDLEFEGGKLVKVRGVRYNYMDGDSLIFLVGQLGQMLGRSEIANKLWQRNATDTHAAMSAMRNDINEHIPMPSIESDLLNGPETSVFCSAVASAVVSFAKREQQTARERFFFPIVMPLNADGQGPASEERGEIRKLTWEVWDQFGGSHGSFDYLPDAIDRADELNRKYGRCYDEGCEHFGTPHAHPEKMEPEKKLTGTLCSECREPQFETPSGATCVNGHGGADPLEE